MPQMSPYKWLIIFFFMMFMMILMVSFIYFFYIPSLKKLTSFKSLNKWIWKW